MKDRAFSFIPFSVGSRDCLGRFLAIVEGKVILAYMLRHFEITLCEGQRNVKTDCYIIPVRPEQGIYVQVRPRKRTQ